MKFLKTFLALLALCAATAPASLSAAELKEGRDYIVVHPVDVPAETPGKIDVVEFFWYGCSHCFDFEPALGKWLKTAPKDVHFQRIPAIFRENWVPGAKLYYTLEAMGLTARLHGEVFDAVHIDRVKLDDQAVLLDWMAKHGVDRKQFADTYASFAVQGKVQRAHQFTRSFGIQGVPAVIVAGKYMPSAAAAGSYGNLLVIVDKLIAKARAENAKKK